ncbi:glycosyltransferase family 2 protein [Pontibacillus halophilus]|uniref:glycosyltransferase family 2 protein n=1 Tax=Pontibacillus halophilus TaxID=516704 RepID=UPI0012E014F6|nr:glycosyltransferase family 2 protein [Pontibacillus halophilus]
MSSIANLVITTFYKFSFKFKNSGVNHKEREKKIIVSLTTFPGRINVVWIAIESLLRQSVKPDKIILWLADSQFDSIESLPKRLQAQQSRGLTIKFCEDLRSHKKYYYTFNDYPNDLIITVDDDVIYPTKTVEVLVNTHVKHPYSICCNRGHLMTLNKDNTLKSYKNWGYNPLDFTGPSKFLCPTGVSGVLYPPNSVNQEVFNRENIRSLCFYADDLWLKVMSLMNNTQVVKTKDFPHYLFTISTSQKESLGQLNIENNQNDEQLINLLHTYDIQLNNQLIKDLS